MQKRLKTSNSIVASFILGKNQTFDNTKKFFFYYIHVGLPANLQFHNIHLEHALRTLQIPKFLLKLSVMFVEVVSQPF